MLDEKVASGGVCGGVNVQSGFSSHTLGLSEMRIMELCERFLFSQRVCGTDSVDTEFLQFGCCLREKVMEEELIFVECDNWGVSD